MQIIRQIKTAATKCNWNYYGSSVAELRGEATSHRRGLPAAPVAAQAGTEGSSAPRQRPPDPAALGQQVPKRRLRPRRASQPLPPTRRAAPKLKLRWDGVRNKWEHVDLNHAVEQWD